MLGPGSDKKSGRVSGRFGRGKEERGTVGGAEGGSSHLDLRHSESDRSAVNIFRSDLTKDLTLVTINPPWWFLSIEYREYRERTQYRKKVRQMVRAAWLLFVQNICWPIRRHSSLSWRRTLKSLSDREGKEISPSLPAWINCFTTCHQFKTLEKVAMFFDTLEAD